MRMEDDTQLLKFIVACCDLNPKVCVRAKALYEAYAVWAQDECIENEMDRTSFGQRIGQLFDRRCRGTGRFYMGLKLHGHA